MSTMYKTINGDTFESIARKVYGDANQSDRIRKANPGTAEPLVAGIVLAVPADTSAPRNNTPAAPAENEDEVAVTINGSRFRFWESVRITRAIDLVDTVELVAPFEPDAEGFRETFRPFSFAPLDVTVGGLPLFTGTMVGVDPDVDPERKTLDVSAYALPGVLGDCTAPASAFPLEFNDQNLQAVATTIADFFGLAVVFNDDPGAVFERVALDPGKAVMPFLADLAKQRGLVIGSSSLGELVFQKSAAAGVPVAVLAQGASPVMTVRPSFSPQEYYSHITGIDPVIIGGEGSQFTVKNPRLQGVVRPMTFESSDSIDADIKTATEAKAGRMFGNMVAYTVEVSTWRDPAGNLWEPNTSISLTAPGAMVYSAYTFTVRSVEFQAGGTSRTAVLDLVIPGAFRGELPEVLPWDG